MNASPLGAGSLAVTDMPRDRKWAAQLAPIVPAPITATCFTAMLPPLDPAEKRLDLPARERRLLVVDEVPGLRRGGHLDIAEEFVEPVRPFALEDGIAGTPEHARRHRDRNAAALGYLAAHHREPRLMRADVPVETA